MLCAMSSADVEAMPDSETTLTKVGAHLIHGWEAVGGHLTITTRRLVFASHAFNVQTGITDIPLQAIGRIDRCNTLGVVPNGLRITLPDGTRYHLVVWNRRRLMQMITAQVRCADPLSRI